MESDSSEIFDSLSLTKNRCNRLVRFLCEFHITFSYESMDQLKRKLNLSPSFKQKTKKLRGKSNMYELSISTCLILRWSSSIDQLYRKFIE
jgi:hypothetical protein